MAQSGILATVSRRRSEVPGAFRIVEAKNLHAEKAENRLQQKKKTAAKIPVTREKYASFFFLKSKSGRNQPGKCRLDSGIRKSSHKSLQRKDQLIQTKTFRTNGMG